MAVVITLVVLVIALALARNEAGANRRMGPFQAFAVGWVLFICAGFVVYVFIRDILEGIRNSFPGA